MLLTKKAIGVLLHGKVELIKRITKLVSEIHNTYLWKLSRNT